MTAYVNEVKMERSSRRCRTRFLQGLWLLILWPHSEVAGQTDDNETFSHRPQNLVDTSHRSVTQFPGEDSLWNRQTWGDHDVLFSDKYTTSAVFPIPTPSRKSPCENVEEVRTAGDGIIELIETERDCNDMWTWDIRTSSPDDGIILQFNDVFLRYGCELGIFTLARGSERVEQRKFTSKKSDNMLFSPLLLQESRVLVVLNAPYSSFKYTTSVVKISHYAHPISRMPHTVYHDTVPSTSLLMYGCSGNITIPTAFRCNMVQQCVFNEDEEGCEYTKQGCEKGWAPYKDQCLKMEFVTLFSYAPGHSHATFPNVAEKTCASKYGGSLAKLPDREGIELVGKMLRQSGHGSAVVDIKKVKPVSKLQRHLYRYLWQWGDKGSPIAYEQQQLQRDGPLLDCATLNAYPGIHFQPLRCVLPGSFPDGYVCMRRNPAQPSVSVSRPLSAHFPPPRRPLDQMPTKQCADGSLVQTFHRCQSDDVDQLSPNGFAVFHCRYGPPVHYALVCDGNGDCVDGSDEINCRSVTESQVDETMFVCDNLQTIAKSQRCNGMTDCFDGSDEVDCTFCNQGYIMCTGVGCVPSLYAMYIDSCPVMPLVSEGKFVLSDPSVLTLDGDGMSRMQPYDRNNDDGLFHCISGNYIPSFLLNNGELDCQFGEDEHIPSENVTCPGYYICQHFGNCVHPDFICDGIYHCPYKDDERYCNLPCPADCVCEGYAYFCTNLSEPQSLLQARYLDLSGSVNVSLHHLKFMTRLQFLNLSYCRLDTAYLRNLSQLNTLDLSFNNLTGFSSLLFERLTSLKTLNLSGNPFVRILDSSFPLFVKSSGLVNLLQLIMTDTGLESLEDKALSALTKLTTLDIRRNNINFYDKEVFFGLNKLHTLLTDDQKLCCSYFHPALTQCHAPVDELSSCTDLLRSDFFRAFLWTFSVLSIIGNAGVLLYRAFGKQKASPPAFRVLVCNLCTADIFMGVYMMIIGIADIKFRGMYVSKESEWKNSLECAIAGFLGLVSSEVSAMVICLITLDRLLVLYFPFKSQLHLKRRSSVTVCGIVWFLGLSIAAAPFWLSLDFYGETSICLPLPVTRHKFSGQFYAFAIFIILNFSLFVLIGMGQICIYCIIRNASKQAGANRRSQELAIARRLFLVVFTDFCCWFPIGLMGLLANRGVPIPGVVNVWAAIFILPLNSAINPFLYTLNTLLEKRRTAQLQQRTRRILGNIQSELPKMESSLAEEVVRVCIRSKIVKKDKMSQWLNIHQDSNISYIESAAESENNKGSVKCSFSE